MSSRELRRLNNTKQNSIEFNGIPSVGGMSDGQIAIEKKTNSQLALYRKKFGKLFKMYMSSDGNQIVDKTLTANALKYTSRFTDYRIFIHSFTDDLPATKIYIPWQGTGEKSSVPDATTSFLSPFNMTCHKLMIRLPELNTATTDIVFTIEETTDGNNAPDTVCTFDYDTTDFGNWQDDTNFTINMSDWNVTPKISSGSVVQIGLNPDNTNIVTSEKHFIITSVWKVEVVV